MGARLRVFLTSEQDKTGACHLCRESDNKDSRSTLSTLL